MCCSPRDNSSRNRLVDMHLFFARATMIMESDIWNLSERAWCGAIHCTTSKVRVSKSVHVFTKISVQTNWGLLHKCQLQSLGGPHVILASLLHVVTFIVMIGVGVMDAVDAPES